MTNTAKIIKGRRTELKLSQAELAKKLGVHTQFISNIERSKCLVPAKKIKKLCRILALPSQDLIEAILMDYRKDIEEKVYG